MEFELSPEVFDQIIFAMEDQSLNGYIHRRTGELVQRPPDDPAEFVPLPPWKPVDGFYLMERFVAAVSNRHFRQQLRVALATGKGVFRSFKNVLKQSRDLEWRWYRFKEKEMRRVVVDWYNQEREAAGLERLGPEPEETDDLTISDFVVVAATPMHLDGAHVADSRGADGAAPGAGTRPGQLPRAAPLRTRRTRFASGGGVRAAR